MMYFDGFRFGFVCACTCSAYRFNIVIAIMGIVFWTRFFSVCLLTFILNVSLSIENTLSLTLQRTFSK